MNRSSTVGMVRLTDWKDRHPSPWSSCGVMAPAMVAVMAPRRIPRTRSTSPWNYRPVCHGTAVPFAWNTHRSRTTAISVARVPTLGDLQRSVCGWNGIGRRRGAWGAATLSAASLRREPPSWRTRPTNSGHSMNARHRPGSAADRADTPWKDLMTDALRYGEPRRLVLQRRAGRPGARRGLAGPAEPLERSRAAGPRHAVRSGGHRQCGLT